MGEAWTETQEGISIFFFSFSALLALVLVLSVSAGFCYGARPYSLAPILIFHFSSTSLLFRNFFMTLKS
jgi:hypothetical protein